MNSATQTAVYLLIRVGSLSTVLALAACGGAVDNEKRDEDAGLICFPAIVDCRDGADCSQGHVCYPTEIAK